MELESFGDITLKELITGPIRKELWVALDAWDIVGHSYPTGAIVLSQAKWLGYAWKFQVRNFSGYWNDKKFPEPREIWGRGTVYPSYAFFLSERSIKSFGIRQKLNGTYILYHESLI